MKQNRSVTLRGAGSIVLTVLALVLAGCKGPMELTVVGGPDMNNGGNAAVVRIYQLASDNNFQRATPENFWRSDEEALGSELLFPKQEVLLYPEQQRTFEMEIGKEVRFVGVAADLRDPIQDQWRQVLPADEVRGQKLTVTIGDDRLVVATN